MSYRFRRLVAFIALESWASHAASCPGVDQAVRGGALKAPAIRRGGAGWCHHQLPSRRNADGEEQAERRNCRRLARVCQWAALQQRLRTAAANDPLIQHELEDRTALLEAARWICRRSGSWGWCWGQRQWKWWWHWRSCCRRR